MKIKMQLRDIIKYDSLIARLGLNPWCLNEGGDGEAEYEIEVDSISISREWLANP